MATSLLFTNANSDSEVISLKNGETLSVSLRKVQIDQKREVSKLNCGKIILKFKVNDDTEQKINFVFYTEEKIPERILDFDQNPFGSAKKISDFKIEINTPNGEKVTLSDYNIIVIFDMEVHQPRLPPLFNPSGFPFNPVPGFNPGRPSGFPVPGFNPDAPSGFPYPGVLPGSGPKIPFNPVGPPPDFNPGVPNPRKNFPPEFPFGPEFDRDF